MDSIFGLVGDNYAILAADAAAVRYNDKLILIIILINHDNNTKGQY